MNYTGPAVPNHAAHLSDSFDDEKHADKLAPGQAAERAAIGDEFESEAEYKSALYRVWFKVVPYFTLLYLLSFLDRVNIGQAKVAGLVTDLNLSNDQYSTALAVFFASYVAFEIPAAILLRFVPPHIFIFVTITCWSICMTLMGIVKTSGQLIAVRFLLGLFESGLFPGLNYVLSMWMPRSAYALATSIFFAGATLAGAFGGLLAYAIRHMAGTQGLNGWQWIFILEGIITFTFGLPSFFLIADWPQTDKKVFKDESQRNKWINHLSQSQGVGSAAVPFSTSQITRAFLDWKAYVFALMYIGIAQPLYSLALFVPTIVANLGYTNVEANLYSAFPYFVGFGTTVGMGLIADRYRIRGPLMVLCMGTTAIGYIILLCNVSVHVKYFAVFLAVMGVSPGIALSISWVGTQFAPAYKRAVGMGLHFMVGNSAGIISSFVYPSTDAPRFILGHSVALGFTGMSIICAIILSFANYTENKRRDREYGVPAADGSETTIAKLFDEEEKKKWGYEGYTDAQILDEGDNHHALRYLW